MSNEIKIENVVASASLNCRVPLDKLVSHLPGTEYEPEQFPGLVYRMEDPKAAALIFSSGKIVCTGARSPELSRKAIDKVIKGVRSIGVNVTGKVDIKVENIVASARINSELPLNQIAFSLENAEYEPEQFPGLVYRMKSPKVAFLLFGSGKIVCTGGRQIEEVQEAVKKLEKQLREVGAIK
ncbi:MAG: TATA-box-binding protein [Candidatus Aenigmarchaeota archaeon]|nr:TATA-box-binding protein [Candidatus Aenigmarchaeota archaeon]